MKVIDEIDEWCLKSLVSVRGMFKDCMTKCEKQIYDSPRIHEGEMDDEFEEKIRKNIVMCSTDCTEAMTSEFSASRRSSRSQILARFQEIEYRLAQVDPRNHPEENWVSPPIDNMTSRASLGEIFPKKTPMDEQNKWYPNIAYPRDGI